MIREFIEDQIHIHEILRMHQRLNTIQLIVELCIQHTLLGPKDLIGNVTNCIAAPADTPITYGSSTFFSIR